MQELVLRPDMHDLLMRDAQIMTLEETNRELKNMLDHATRCLLYYSGQHNGHLASQTLCLIERGGQ